MFQAWASASQPSSQLDACGLSSKSLTDLAQETKLTTRRSEARIRSSLDNPQRRGGQHSREMSSVIGGHGRVAQSSVERPEIKDVSTSAGSREVEHGAERNSRSVPNATGCAGADCIKRGRVMVINSPTVRTHGGNRCYAGRSGSEVEAALDGGPLPEVFSRLQPDANPPPSGGGGAQRLSQWRSRSLPSGGDEETSSVATAGDVQRVADFAHFLRTEAPNVVSQLGLPYCEHIGQVHARNLLQAVLRTHLHFGGCSAQGRCDRRDRRRVKHSQK